MLTEEYRGWKPWKCHGCSAELQFSAAYLRTVQLGFLLVVLLFLYITGFRGWQLFGGTIFLGLALTVFVGPLTRVLPPKLERYCPPPWKTDKFVTLFPHGVAGTERPDGDGQSEHEQPSSLQSANGPQRDG